MSSVGEMLDRGIKVSLGTDISGGFGLGILSAMWVLSYWNCRICWLDYSVEMPPFAPKSEL